MLTKMEAFRPACLDLVRYLDYEHVYSLVIDVNVVLMGAGISICWVKHSNTTHLEVEWRRYAIVWLWLSLH